MTTCAQAIKEVFMSKEQRPSLKFDEVKKEAAG